MTEQSKSRSDTEALADLLEKLGARATQGPWAWDHRGEKINEWGLGVAFDSAEKPLSGEFTDEDAQYVEQVCQTEGATVNYADPDLICALRNNLQDIIAALRVRSEQGRSDPFSRVIELINALRKRPHDPRLCLPAYEEGWNAALHEVIKLFVRPQPAERNSE